MKAVFIFGHSAWKQTCNFEGEEHDMQRAACRASSPFAPFGCFLQWTFYCLNLFWFSGKKTLLTTSTASYACRDKCRNSQMPASMCHSACTVYSVHCCLLQRVRQGWIVTSCERWPQHGRLYMHKARNLKVGRKKKKSDLQRKGFFYRKTGLPVRITVLAV